MDKCEIRPRCPKYAISDSHQNVRARKSTPKQNSITIWLRFALPSPYSQAPCTDFYAQYVRLKNKVLHSDPFLYKVEYLRAYLVGQNMLPCKLEVE